MVVNTLPRGKIPEIALLETLMFCAGFLNGSWKVLDPKDRCIYPKIGKPIQINHMLLPFAFLFIGAFIILAVFLIIRKTKRKD